MSAPITSGVRRVLVLVIAGCVTALVAIFLKLADSVRESEFVVGIDRHVLEFVVHHRVAWISSLARVATNLGSAWVVAIVTVGGVVLLVRNHHRLDALFVALGPIGTALLVVAAKHLIGRPRPIASNRLVGASGEAFPSGHAAQSVACYAALVVIAFGSRSNRTRVLASAAATVIVLAVGGSRVYLGVHWPSDVVSGWLLAAGWLLALLGAREVFDGRNQRDRPLSPTLSGGSGSGLDQTLPMGPPT